MFLLYLKQAALNVFHSVASLRRVFARVPQILNYPSAFVYDPLIACQDQSCEDNVIDTSFMVGKLWCSALSSALKSISIPIEEPIIASVHVSGGSVVDVVSLSDALGAVDIFELKCAHQTLLNI